MAAKNDQQRNQDTLMSLCDLGATKFVELFYKIADYQRDKIDQFYRETSTVQFNGQAIKGADLQAFWKAMPLSHHTLISLNAQPIPVFQPSLTPNIMVTATGKVSYFGSNVQFFSQTFVLGTETIPNSATNASQYYVVSDIFRLQGDIN